jgi:H+/Cl- antiporter ClcA
VSAPAQPSVGAAYLKLVLLAGLIGIPAALLAAGFLGGVHELEHWMWGESPRWYAVLGLPVLGALLVLVARRLLPGDGGHPPLEGLSTAPTPLTHAPGIALAALGTLAFGAVLGPEAPVIALGSAVGVAAARLARAEERAVPALSLAGSVSAISALFGGPLVAGLLMVEAGIGMGKALLPVLLPALVSAAIGYVIFIGLGDWGGLHAAGLTVPDLPLYEGTNVPDLIVAVAAGIVTALLIGMVRRLARRVEGAPVGMAPSLIGGALLVGGLALAADALGADSQEVLFSGQSSVPALVASGTTKVVLILLVAKALAYAVSLGCGFRGGPIFPAIFLGVGVATLADVWFGVSPTVTIAVGTAAGMAAESRLVVAPVLFAALLVGHDGADAIPAAVLAAAGAWITMSWLEPQPQESP